MSNTPTTLRETLIKFRGAQPKPNEKEAWDNLARQIKEQLKALLPEKYTPAEMMADIDSSADYRQGFNQAIDQIEKAIEEWAK